MDTSDGSRAVLSVVLPRLFAAVDEGADDVHGQRLTRTQVVAPQLSEHVLARLFYHLLHTKSMLISCEVYQASQMGSCSEEESSWGQRAAPVLLLPARTGTHNACSFSRQSLGQQGPFNSKLHSSLVQEDLSPRNGLRIMGRLGGWWGRGHAHWLTGFTDKRVKPSTGDILHAEDVRLICLDHILLRRG